jgi:hypothetical protein
MENVVRQGAIAVMATLACKLEDSTSRGHPALLSHMLDVEMPVEH